MRNSFVKSLETQHEHFLKAFEDYRNQLTEVLFYGERISRAELKDGKKEFIRGLREEMDAVQSVLLPAITVSQKEWTVSGVKLFAQVQDKLRETVTRTEENVNFFANPEAPKDERNEAAREILKYLYRLDSALTIYFSLLEKHLLPVGDKRLEDDEKEKLLQPLAHFYRPDPNNS